MWFIWSLWSEEAQPKLAEYMMLLAGENLCKDLLSTVPTISANKGIENELASERGLV